MPRGDIRRAHMVYANLRLLQLFAPFVRFFGSPSTFRGLHLMHDTDCRTQTYTFRDDLINEQINRRY